MSNLKKQTNKQDFSDISQNLYLQSQKMACVMTFKKAFGVYLAAVETSRKEKNICNWVVLMICNCSLTNQYGKSEMQDDLITYKNQMEIDTEKERRE